MSKNGKNQYETIGATYWTSVHWQRHIVQCLSLVMALVFPMKGNQRDRVIAYWSQIQYHTHCINVSMYWFNISTKKTAVNLCEFCKTTLMDSFSYTVWKVTWWRVSRFKQKHRCLKPFYIVGSIFHGETIMPIGSKKNLKKKVKLSNLSSWTNYPLPLSHTFCLTPKQRGSGKKWNCLLYEIHWGNHFHKHLFFVAPQS